MIPRVPLREALSDPNLLGTAIAGDSWRSWRALLIAAMGEELSADEREIFTQLTGRVREPLQRVDEFAAVIGRRGGKSKAIATVASYIAGLCDHRDALVPGERGVLLCVALDQRVAKIILDYAEACFERSPILKQLIANRTADALELTNGISLEVRPASFRKLRGPTYIAVIADELAFWYVDAAYANPDVEILNAVEPGLATTGGPLILASSPHARRGALWDVFKRHYGANGDPLILVAHGASRTLNPSLPQRVVDRALEKDRARATAEYLAQFRTDVEGFVAIEIVEACTGDYREMLPAANNFYRAFTDPSGGSDDSFALAISHKSNDRIIIDAIREARPPFSPDAVVDDFAALLKSYRVSRVTGDRYAGEFPRELFRKHGIAYDLAKQTKSELFRDLLPLLNSDVANAVDRIVLPRNDRRLAGKCHPPAVPAAAPDGSSASTAAACEDPRRRSPPALLYVLFAPQPSIAPVYLVRSRLKPRWLRAVRFRSDAKAGKFVTPRGQRFLQANQQPDLWAKTIRCLSGRVGSFKRKPQNHAAAAADASCLLPGIKKMLGRSGKRRPGRLAVDLLTKESRLSACDVSTKEGGHHAIPRFDEGARLSLGRLTAGSQPSAIGDRSGGRERAS